MMRYLQLWLKFLETSWMADMEYRLNMVMRVIAESGWYLAQLSVFEVLYTHTQTISGWDVHGMRVFMGTLFLGDVIYMILFMENLENFFSLIRRGDLDQLLTKPIDSQFLVSMKKVSTAYVINLVGICAYLGWAIYTLPQPWSGFQLAVYFVLLFFGVILVYALRFMFMSLILVMQDAGNIHFLWHQLFRLATRPDPLYPFYLRMIVMTILPLAFFASVPSRVLVEGFDWRLGVASALIALTALYLSHAFWNAALKRYSSASS